MGAEDTLGKGITPGDPRPPTDDGRHSYEDFTQRPFYRAINRQTVKLAPDRNVAILDVATGTGGIIELLLEERKISPMGAAIVGVDIDAGALEEARKKLPNQVTTQGAVVKFDFHTASAEATGERDNSFDLVTFCNAIHLTDVPKSMEEAYRVLEPGGIVIANSAFVDGIGYPTPEAEHLWRNIGSRAVRKAIKAGHRPEKNTDFVTRTQEDYVKAAQDAGFKDVNTLLIEATMDLGDVLAICHYDEFARGALKGVPLEVAHEVLAEAAVEVFESLRVNGQPEAIPRNWMVIKARKPSR